MKNHSKIPKKTHPLTYEQLVPSFDWSLLFRLASRFVGFLGVAYLTYILKIYADVAGVGALGSIGKYITGLFFFYMLMITGEKYQSWNFLFLSGLYCVVITF